MKPLWKIDKQIEELEAERMECLKKGEQLLNTPVIWNPIPRFEKIDQGICPDCDSQLDHNGYCADCHFVPSLDAEFRQWLSKPACHYRP